MSVHSAAIAQEPKSNVAQPQYKRLAALSWLHFLNDGSANYLPGILPAVLLGLHLDTAMAGPIMSALLIGQALQVISGWFADHIGGRGFIVFGVLGSSLSAAVIGLAPSLWVLIPALIMVGVSSAVFHPQAIAGARSLSGDRRGFGMSLFLVGGELGRGLWPLLASLVVVYWGLHALWYLALPAVLSVLLFWKLLPVQSPRDLASKPIVWRRHLAPMSALVSFSMLRALTIFGLVTFLPLLWHERGFDLTEGATLITILLVTGIIGNVGGGHISDLIGRRTVLFASSLASALLLVAFMESSGALQLAILGLLGISLFATMPLSVLIGQDIFPENRSLGSGIALGLSNGLAAVALMGLSVIQAVYGVDTVLWGLVAIVFSAGFISLLLPDR